MNPLKEKRQKLNLTRVEISKRLNTNIYNINEWECNRTSPKSYMLIDIALAYEMSNEELIEYLKYLKRRKE